MNTAILATFSLLLPSLCYPHGVTEAQQHAMAHAHWHDYISFGAIHMVTGYDHILFLLGVIFFLTKFSDIFKYITIFTLGHSLTLVFATLYKITANPYLIDAVIALSVCYKGFDNLRGFQDFLKIDPPHLGSVIFLFGLIHGFGLSTRLQEISLGDSNILGKILAFNIGVELGQIAALSAMLLLLMLWRSHSTFQPFSKAVNSLLIFAGLFLFTMQMHDYSHHDNGDQCHHEEKTTGCHHDKEKHGHQKTSAPPGSGVLMPHKHHGHSHHKHHDHDH